MWTTENTELHKWFERDRQHVELRDIDTDKTVVEWWDEDVTQALEDGFLNRVGGIMLVRCNVERHAGVCLLITFPDHPGKSLLLQSDTDQSSFAYSCGICDDSSPLSQSYVDCEPTDIERCPDDYLDIAEDDHGIL